jgi:hypothetical protein
MREAAIPDAGFSGRLGIEYSHFSQALPLKFIEGPLLGK